MSRLWDRGTPLDAQIERFTVGADPLLDRQLVAHDALASAAHATMLARIGVLPAAELPRVVAALGQIAAEAREGRFCIELAEEDGHTAIENRLTTELGDVGRRIHTGRSRNDQVICALRLFGREQLLACYRLMVDLARQLVALAEQHRVVTVAGYTHTRQAMPSTLGLLFGAHAEGLVDGLPWLQQAFAHLNRSPLGSASGYGVSLPLDRQLVADLLAFDGVQANTLAVQNDRGKTEFLVLGTLVAPCVDLGRLATDLIFLSADELRALRLSHAVTTGSSIMPQKRNPDVLELVRAASAKLRSRQAEVGAIYGGLPSGYQRDLQLTKEPFIESLLLARDLFAAMGAALAGVEVDAERCRELLLPTTGATDVLYRRVAAGEPFRSAYKDVARDPAAAVAGQAIEDAWKGRTYLGAPGGLDFSPLAAQLDQHESWLERCAERVEGAWSLLAPISA